MRLCSKCDGPNDRGGQRYCRSCHAEYQRTHRPKHSDLSETARIKAVARAYANTYKRRGKIKQENCFICDDVSDHMHHEDYTRPLDILWLCKKCHLTVHAFHMEHPNPTIGRMSHEK